jgi:hypothetical protein
MLNVSERSLVNVYCFSLFFGENVEQAVPVVAVAERVDGTSKFCLFLLQWLRPFWAELEGAPVILLLLGAS